MSKVLPSLPSRTAEAGRPYNNNSVVVGSSSSSMSVPAERRLTVHNLHSFEKREKRLPVDACTQKAPHMKLYHFPERVLFLCNRCRKDGITSDTCAVDTVNQVILCSRCVTRVIRPREYTPSRVVPFPSLLSWLNYKPSTVMQAVPTDVTARPAEAVAPTGHRVATGMLGGGYSDLRALPATPMTAAAEVQSSSVASSLSTTHPCERVWGSCTHGVMCYFRNAPRSLCIAYLMGLCDGNTATCSLVHQRVLDLPVEPSTRPPRLQEVPTATSATPENARFSEWIREQQQSPNKALWQLWNNGSTANLLNTFVPIVEAPKPSTAAMAFNLTDITAALKFVK